MLYSVLCSVLCSFTDRGSFTLLINQEVGLTLMILEIFVSAIVEADPGLSSEVPIPKWEPSQLVGHMFPTTA